MPDHPILASIRTKLAEPSKKFSFLVDFLAQPGRGGELAAAINASRVIPLTHQEPGCLTYDITQDVDVPESLSRTNAGPTSTRWRRTCRLSIFIASARRWINTWPGRRRFAC